MIDAANIHFQRALDFLKDARTAQSPDDKSRFLASSIENAVAIVEVFLSSVKDKEKLRHLAWDKIPRYRLLKRIRIHEFHRRPLPTSPPNFKEIYMQGPITLNTGTQAHSSVSVMLTPQGPKYNTTGSGKIDRNPGVTEKEIWKFNEKLWDEFKKDWVDIENALVEFIGKVPDFLKEATLLELE